MLLQKQQQSVKDCSSLVRSSSGRCPAAGSWCTTGWESRVSGASQRSGRFQSVWPRCAELWCPLAGPGGRPLCILLLSGTGNRHRHSAVRQSAPTTQHQSVMWAAPGSPTSTTGCSQLILAAEQRFIHLKDKCPHFAKPQTDPNQNVRPLLAFISTLKRVFIKTVRLYWRHPLHSHSAGRKKKRVDDWLSLRWQRWHGAIAFISSGSDLNNIQEEFLAFPLSKTAPARTHL